MQAQVISFNCILKNKAGLLISSTYNREVLTAVDADPGGTLLGLSKQLQNLTKGEKRSFTVMAEEAYGLYDPSKVILFPRKKLPTTAKKGDTVKIVGQSGKMRSYHVLDFYDDFANLDGNHPLAGQDLIFEIETLEARDATPKDMKDSDNRMGRQLLH